MQFSKIRMKSPDGMWERECSLQKGCEEIYTCLFVVHALCGVEKNPTLT